MGLDDVFQSLEFSTKHQKEKSLASVLLTKAVRYFLVAIKHLLTRSSIRWEYFMTNILNSILSPVEDSAVQKQYDINPSFHIC